MNDNTYLNNPLERLEQRLDGSVYIGVAGSSFTISAAMRSVYNLHRREGDGLPVIGEFTKGAEAREWHIQRFLESEHAFILLLDGDMWFPEHALERARCHGLPCVSGLYFRRTHMPRVIPIWYEDDPLFRWPMMPFRDTPERGRLYRLGATGFGFWLIHRSVFEAVRPLLHGEAFVWQDDMDVWPYDLQAVVDGHEQIRVLRGLKDQIGADIRLSFFIRQAGFTIWGDPEIGCGHYINYPLSLTDWESYSAEQQTAYALGTEYDIERIRAQYAEEAVTA